MTVKNKLNHMTFGTRLVIVKINKKLNLMEKFIYNVIYKSSKKANCQNFSKYVNLFT